jgi:RNA polymerase sigma-70 factor, ECF subfamily
VPPVGGVSGCSFGHRVECEQLPFSQRQSIFWCSFRCHFCPYIMSALVGGRFGIAECLSIGGQSGVSSMTSTAMRDEPFPPDPRTGEFMRLLLQNERQLRTFTVSLVPHWADAEDILQDAKLELWERFAEYDHTGDFGAWARSIIFYRVKTFRKKSGRERVHFSQTAFDLVAAEASVVANETESRLFALAACIKKLTEAARILLWRCTVSGATVKDVAVNLGRSVRGTQRAVANIRRDLQECIERQMRSEEHP